MPATFATFKRLKDKGIAALKRGDHVTARPYLIQAAECMIEIAAWRFTGPRNDILNRFQGSFSS